jgi:hypothetical protein
MKITTEYYPESTRQTPSHGQHILAHQQGSQLVVYQAYKASIAAYAVAHQQLGGSEYSYNRMSWIKPNFLWMMFRCGWAEKENQQRILAIWIEKTDFDMLLQQAVLSSFNSRYYDTHDTWREELDRKDVRLQWDPDHDPHGNKIVRRALQLGLKGETLEKFGKHDIKLVEDVTGFVHQQKQFVRNNQPDKLLVPEERVYVPAGSALCRRIGIESQDY